MPGWLTNRIQAEADRLLTLARDDPALRAELRALGERLLDETATQSAVAPEPDPGGPLHALTFGRSPTPHLPPPSTADRADGGLDDLIDLDIACRLRVDAARAVAERLRADLAPGERGHSAAHWDHETAAWADRLHHAFDDRNAEGADAGGCVEIADVDDLAGCFEALAEAIGLAGASSRNGKGLDAALGLLSEAQSALRVAISTIFGAGVTDPDQLRAFAWLKEAAARNRVFLRRYMRLDDPADPRRWSCLLGRIATRAGRSGSGPVHAREAALEKVHNAATGSSVTELIAAIEAAVTAGVAPSHREFRGSLLPVVETLPDRDDLPPGVRLVLRELDRHLAARELDDAGTPAHAERTPEVSEARRLLAGHAAVLIGGKCRGRARAALVEALGLSELVWVETKGHQSVSTFEPSVARDDVAVVLLAIRWSSHSFGEVRLFCERHGKPLVRLPGGYSPNQVAAQVVAQCSGQLEGDG